MKHLIVFGLTLALLLSVALPAAADDGDIRPVDDGPIAGINFRQLAEELFEAAGDAEPPVVFDRPWCGDGCASRQRNLRERADDGSDGCLRWRGWYSRCLIKQRAWPSCACVYTDWHLEGSEWCVEWG